MRTFAVTCILLALAVAAPASGEGGRFDAAWGFGLIMLLAFAGQQVARTLGLPPLVGWLAAGILLGRGGLEAVRPTHVDTLHLVHVFAAIWVSFQVGLGLAVPTAHRAWKLAGTVAASTAVAFAVTAAGVALVLEQPWSLAVLIGGLACLWGPFALSTLVDDEETQLASVIGAAVGLALLGTAIVMLQRRGLLPYAAVLSVSALLISLVAGGAVGEVLWQLRVFLRRAAAVTALAAMFLLTAALVEHLQLFALPFGFACGLVVRWRQAGSDMLRHLLEPARPLAAMVFFALIGASLDVVDIARTPHPLLWQIVVIQLVVLVVLRGVGPAIWYPSPATDNPRHRWYAALLLLPRGALLFELVFWPQGGLLVLVSAPTAHLLRQLVVVDLLLYGALFSIVAVSVAGLFRPEPEPAPDNGDEAAAVPGGV